MTKDIKDYLHLYLGCEVVTKWGVKGTLVSYWNPKADYIPRPICKILRSDAYGVVIDCDVKDITPILRPLSDMTEEEIKELIRFDKMREDYHSVEYSRNIANGRLTGINISYTIDADGEGYYSNQWCLDFAAMNAYDCAWLLSKSFDLFGLIDSGLAINKTTL